MIAAIEKLQSIEDSLMQSLSENFLNDDLKRSKVLKKLFVLFTRLGDGFVYPIIIFFLILNSKLNLTHFLTFLIAFTIERIFYFSIKNSTRRLRPFEKLKINNLPILPPDRYSFPSGHTSAAFLFATLIGTYFTPFLIFVFLYALLVGLSRIILNLHYPTDVFIGSQLGILIGIISIEVMKLIL
ncbi:MAG: phosphatase PAP2 family protein [Ignavibacteria bacterium]